MLLLLLLLLSPAHAPRGPQQPHTRAGSLATSLPPPLSLAPVFSASAGAGPSGAFPFAPLARADRSCSVRLLVACACAARLPRVTRPRWAASFCRAKPSGRSRRRRGSAVGPPAGLHPHLDPPVRGAPAMHPSRSCPRTGRGPLQALPIQPIGERGPPAQAKKVPGLVTSLGHVVTELLPASVDPLCAPLPPCRATSHMHVPFLRPYRGSIRWGQNRPSDGSELRAPAHLPLVQDHCVGQTEMLVLVCPPLAPPPYSVRFLVGQAPGISLALGFQTVHVLHLRTHPVRSRLSFQLGGSSVGAVLARFTYAPTESVWTTEPGRKRDWPPAKMDVCSSSSFSLPPPRPET